jgi:Xaa-Pro aminopeptidase/Xaa-Pro dipeptidase
MALASGPATKTLIQRYGSDIELEATLTMPHPITSPVAPDSLSLPMILKQRRLRLAAQVEFPVVLWAGGRSSRNYPANTYPFRASSHFLYFAGLPLPHAAIHLYDGTLTLFLDDATPADRLWHGDTPPRDEIAAQIGAEAAYPLDQLKDFTAGAATIPVPDPATRLLQSQLLDRPLTPNRLHDHDRLLAEAIIQLRLSHDAAAVHEIRRAATITVAAHRAGMAATPHAQTEAEVRAAMEAVVMAHNTTCAYSSIVTVHGEVLHNEQYHHLLQPGDLLLADLGAEAPSGWASDVTRTWPVSGQFSPTQRDLYDVVLAAHDQCIQQSRPGVEYRDLHLLAAQVIAAGLSDLGILRGRAEDLVAMDAHALFFPHGVGHLLGLDVHDMEDLGDLAGYEAGRVRSDRFGLSYLRLDRPLRPGMAVTIEPGFYQVPAILQDPERQQRYREVVNWERLAQFADVRGIRIEDDVLITETGSEVLTAALPTQADAIEQLVQGELSAQPQSSQSRQVVNREC